jgi:hypothetical protein
MVEEQNVAKKRFQIRNLHDTISGGFVRGVKARYGLSGANVILKCKDY